MDPQVATIAVAAISIIPATLAAHWARNAKTDAAAARENSAGTLHEVNSNGGMNGPNPTLKDHAQHLEVLVELLSSQVTNNTKRTQNLEFLLDDHLKECSVSNQALVELYLAYKNKQL